MIMEIKGGDITSPDNEKDIIIGMNTELKELSTIGQLVLKGGLPRPSLIDLGTVLTFNYDETRLVHMLVCHHHGEGGWRCADQYVRVGLDHLWVTRNDREFSIVQIGTGRVGRRDGAKAPAILSAIATSYLPVDLYIRSGDRLVPDDVPTQPKSLEFVSGFSQKSGSLVPA